MAGKGHTHTQSVERIGEHATERRIVKREEKERQVGKEKGNRGTFHVTAIINGYIPALSHGTILAKKGTAESERRRQTGVVRGGGGGGQRREGEGAFE